MTQSIIQLNNNELALQSVVLLRSSLPTLFKRNCI